MRGVAILVTLAMLLTGCTVSKTFVKNWKPDDYSRANTFYECLKEAQQIESKAAFGANQQGAYGGASQRAETNKRIMTACMGAKGYQLRKATGVELVLSLITFPLALFFMLLGQDMDIYE